MGDQPRRGIAPPDRHGKGRDDQIAGDPLRHEPAHHRAGIDIQHHRKVEPALVGADVGHIRQPHPVWRGGGEILFQPVRGRGQAK